MRTFFHALCCLLIVTPAAQAQAKTHFPITQEALLAYLDQLTQWQRDAAIIEPTATNLREVVFRDSLRDNAGKVLENGFTFMRSVADTQPSTIEVDPQSTRMLMTVRAKALTQRIGELKTQTGRLSGDARTEAADQLRLAEARLDLVKTILANLNAASNKSPNKLAYTLDSMARAMPELNGDSKAVTDTNTTATERRASGSIIGLSVDIFDVIRKERELDDMIAQTSLLKKNSMELMKKLRSGLGEPDAAHETVEEAKTSANTLSVDEQVAAYKQLGSSIIPLGTTMRWIDASKQTMQEWLGVLGQHRAEVLKQLIIRVGALIISLAIPIGISELVRGALKHVPDSKRKQQLNIIRRLLKSIAVVLILLLYFISDFSSFATFAGFLTAGMAVALQSVLLSLVAHFLFYGRYGVRVGDRVNVSGVTGDIVKIGMVRFHLRELKDIDGTLTATGKTVAFPNSVLFQNQAFYKYT